MSEINKAIAEHCGWKNIHTQVYSDANVGTLKVLVGNPPDCPLKNIQVPDYQRDLNAMHSAWLSFSKVHQKAAFYVELRKIVESEMPGQNVGLSDIVNATAQQRAEAFLAAIKRIEDDYIQATAAQSIANMAACS
jgi:hypothetical protein